MHPHHDKIDRRLTFGLVCLFLLVYLLPLGVRPIANPDEARYGEIAREMIVSGDWVTPRLNGVRYFEKPIMGHWLNAVSLKAFGENGFALRLPSALAVALTALLIYWLSVTCMNRRTGLLASGIYLTTVSVFGIGTFAVLDTYLTLFLTAALTFYFLAYRSHSPRQRYGWLAAFGVATGCAFLTKGFLGIVIPGVVIAPFLALERRWRSMLVDPWIPALVAGAVALPWAILIHLREPDFWRYFVVVEHLQRFMGDGEIVQHERPWYYFIVLMPVFVFPWLLFMPRAIRRMPKDFRLKPFVRYLLAWALLPLLFFSASSGKLMTYVLPCVVPISILLAAGFQRSTGHEPEAMPRWPLIVNGAGLGIGAIALIAAQVSRSFYGTDESLTFAYMTGALVAGTVLPFLALRSRNALVQMTLTAFAVLPVCLGLTLALPKYILVDKAPAAFIEQHGPYAADSLLVADSGIFNAMSWTLKRDDVYVFGQSELDYGMSYPDARHRQLDEAALHRLIETRAHRDVALLIKADREQALADILPSGAQRAAVGELVLWRIKGIRHPDG